MSSTRPLQWIEQAEAREMMTDAMFRQAPVTSRRKRAQVAAAEWLRRRSRQWVSQMMPEWPVLQAQPALVRRQDRRPVRRDDPYR